MCVSIPSPDIADDEMLYIMSTDHIDRHLLNRAKLPGSNIGDTQVHLFSLCVLSAHERDVKQAD